MNQLLLFKQAHVWRNFNSFQRFQHPPHDCGIHCRRRELQIARAQGHTISTLASVDGEAASSGGSASSSAPVGVRQQQTEVLTID